MPEKIMASETIMDNTQNSILILRTKNSIREEFEETIDQLQNYYGFSCTVCEDFPSAKLTLDSKHEFNIIIVHLNSLRDDNELWRKTLYESKARNKFSETIVVVEDEDKQDNIKAGDVLSSGCFAFFQYEYNREVLLGYITAALKKSRERRERTDLSHELNKSANIRSVAAIIAYQLEKITSYNNITISLLKESKNNQGFLRKLLFTNSPENIQWDLLEPTINDELITTILSGKITRRVFPNPETDEDIKHLFNKESKTPRVKSWIVLPLIHAGLPIGLITLDGYEPNQFNYENVNEVALERIANQAATAIRYAERHEAHEKLVLALDALDRSKSLKETLEKLAEQACKLVNGLFSYIVMPNLPDRAATYLRFEAAWSRHHGNEYIERLNRMVSFPDPLTKRNLPGFLLSPFNADIKEKGITTIAYEKREIQLLEHIQNGNYKEISAEARREYFEFLYKYEEDGKIKKLPTNSDIALPILSADGQVFGVINVEHEDPFAFTEEHINALRDLASFASIAISKELDQNLLKDLYHLSNFLYEENSTFDDIQTFLDNVAEIVRQISKAKYVSVFSVKDNKSFFIGKTNNPPRHLKEGSRPYAPDSMGHTFWCIKNRKPVIIPDTKSYQEDPSKFNDILGNQYIRENGTYIEINKQTDINTIRALVCLPMLLPSGKATGVIWMHLEANPNYSREQVELFQVLANRAAYTLHIAETLSFKDIEIKIGATLDKTSVLKEIIESAKNYFGLQGVAIYEDDASIKKLRRVASNIRLFDAGEIIEYDEGLAGHLFLGKDTQNYKYSRGYLHVEDYSLYEHNIKAYSDNQKKALGSLFGVRLPHNPDIGEPIGILIASSALGRSYEETKDGLIHLANIAGKHLLHIRAIEDERKILKESGPKAKTPLDLIKARETKWQTRDAIKNMVIVFLALMLSGLVFGYLIFGRITNWALLVVAIAFFGSLIYGSRNQALKRYREKILTGLALEIIIAILTGIITYIYYTLQGIVFPP